MGRSCGSPEEIGELGIRIDDASVCIMPVAIAQVNVGIGAVGRCDIGLEAHGPVDGCPPHGGEGHDLGYGIGIRTTVGGILVETDRSHGDGPRCIGMPHNGGGALTPVLQECEFLPAPEEHQLEGDRHIGTAGDGNHHVGQYGLLFHVEGDHLDGEQPGVVVVEAKDHAGILVGEKEIHVGLGGQHGRIGTIVPLKDRRIDHPRLEAHRSFCITGPGPVVFLPCNVVDVGSRQELLCKGPGAEITGRGKKGDPLCGRIVDGL